MNSETSRGPSRIVAVSLGALGIPMGKSAHTPSRGALDERSIRKVAILSSASTTENPEELRRERMTQTRVQRKVSEKDDDMQTDGPGENSHTHSHAQTSRRRHVRMSPRRRSRSRENVSIFDKLEGVPKSFQSASSRTRGELRLHPVAHASARHVMQHIRPIDGVHRQVLLNPPSSTYKQTQAPGRDGLWTHDKFAEEVGEMLPGSAVFVRGIPKTLSRHALEALFSKCGTVLSVKIEEGQLRTCIITFCERGGGAAAVSALHGHRVQQSSLKVAILDRQQESGTIQSDDDDLDYLHVPASGGVTRRDRVGERMAESSTVPRRRFKMAADEYLQNQGVRVSIFDRLS